jgi:hypothetical protein
MQWLGMANIALCAGLFVYVLFLAAYTEAFRFLANVPEHWVR